MIRMMLAAAAGLLLIAPAANAAPPQRKQRKITRKHVKRNTPKKQNNSAGAKAGRAAAGALANLCPKTITCKVGQQADVTFTKASGPSTGSDKRLHCRYQTAGFQPIATRKARCTDMPVVIASCKGHNKRLVSPKRAWVSSRAGKPRDGKCPVQANVTLRTK